jgi:ABC-type Fe3+/spermidine/putrescine transport system ATPase subunit
MNLDIGDPHAPRLTQLPEADNMISSKRQKNSMANQVAVGLAGISKNYGPVTAVKPLDLEIFAGDFLAILGPSGCGKTTLLRMIGGFIEPSSGRIMVSGTDVTEQPPERRPTNMVFQGYGLFPHMTARQNIAYGLKLKRTAAPDIEARTRRMLELTKIAPLADRMPGELSGGQQQRVAVARALIMEPPVLLLDEPFSALDLKLRQSMQEELRRIHREVGGTFVFVTHDQGEAMALANRIAVMNDGKLEQLGSPEDLYLRPQSRFVAQFIGEANVLSGKRVGDRVRLKCGAEFASPGADGPVVAVIRPESVLLSSGSEGHVKADGMIEDVTFFGTHVRHVLLLRSGERLRQNSPINGTTGAPGSDGKVSWQFDSMIVLEDRD